MLVGSATANPTSSGGTALPQSAFVVTPSTFSFGAKSLSSTTSQTFTVYNQADTTAGITNVSLVGTMYSTTGDTCTGNILAPATSCTISISFTPTSPGNFVAVVSIDFSSSFSTIVSTSFNMNGAGILTQETGLGVSRVNSTLSLVDGIFSPGRLSFAPVINSHYGLMLGDPSGIPGGSYNPFGYRCVGEVP